jgi:hypothetical protein
MRLILAVASLSLVACDTTTTTPVCAVDDVDCFVEHLAFVDASGNVTNAVLVDTATVQALEAGTASSSSAPVLTSGPAEFSYPDGTAVGTILLADDMNLSFTDPNGCTPMVAFAVVHGTTRSTHLGCFPGLRDMRKTGTITNSVGFSANATVPESLDFELAAISSTNCASIDDPATLITTATAVANDPVTIPLMITPPPSGSGSGSGSDTCPGGLLASTLECTPLGSGGVASTCITAAEYMQATGEPLPAACAPSGTTGCLSSSGTLVAPCCPNLTCEDSASCGDSTNAAGGTCK